jgi:hypothetical protein
VAFSKDAQGNWQVTAPEARPADPLAVSSAVAQLTNMSLNTTLTTTTDLAPFGVLSPTYTLELKLVDGAQLRASIGDKTPLGTEYYVLRNGEQNAIVINSGNIESLVALLDSPPYFVPTETPSPTVDAAATILAPSATPGAPQSTPSATP